MPVDQGTDLRTPAQQRRRQRARLAVARAAMDLFRERGYEATTVQDIAGAADISYRTFFRYFATKEDVVFLDVEHHLDGFRAAIADDGSWSAVRDGLLGVMDRFAESHEGFGSTSLRIWMDDPGMAGPFARFCRRWTDTVAAVWVSDGALDAQVRAHAVVGAMLAAFRVHLAESGTLREQVEAALDRVAPVVSPRADG